MLVDPSKCLTTALKADVVCACDLRLVLHLDTDERDEIDDRRLGGRANLLLVFDR